MQKLAILSLVLLGTTASAQAYDWTGFYAGVYGGYTSTQSEASYDSPDIGGQVPIPFSQFDLDSAPMGAVGGVTFGLNHSMGVVVIGIEGDLGTGNVTDTIYDDFADYAGRPDNYITSTADLNASVRGRIGIQAGDWMPFLTAGLVTTHVSVGATDGDLSDEAWLNGWVVSAGTEVAVSDNAAIKAEYLYTDLGEHTWFDGELWASTSHSTSSTVRLGINFEMN